MTKKELYNFLIPVVSRCRWLRNRVFSIFNSILLAIKFRKIFTCSIWYWRTKAMSFKPKILNTISKWYQFFSQISTFTKWFLLSIRFFIDFRKFLKTLFFVFFYVARAQLFKKLFFFKLIIYHYTWLLKATIVHLKSAISGCVYECLSLEYKSQLCHAKCADILHFANKTNVLFNTRIQRINWYL